MTEVQKQIIRKTEAEIQEMPGGEEIRTFIFMELARIQHTRVNDQYHIFAVRDSDGEEEIRNIMLELSGRIIREVRK